MAEITEPVMMVAGSSDFIAPAIPEQIHPFIWLETPQKYLATFVPASHVSINGEIDFPDQVDVAPQVSSLLTGPAPELSTDYAHALNVAFMGFYLSDRSEYEKFGSNRIGPGRIGSGRIGSDRVGSDPVESGPRTAARRGRDDRSVATGRRSYSSVVVASMSRSSR